MKKPAKVVLTLLAFLLVGILWTLIRGRVIFTPDVTLSDLILEGNNCNKLAKVSGKVTSLIGAQGYVLAQNGTEVRIAVPGDHVKQRGLPAIGDDLHPTVMVTCSSDIAGSGPRPSLILETTRTP
jgi:hypothetical protein